VVYNGIDLERWRPNRDLDAVRALGVDPDRPTVIFVGRITRQKGLPYLLRAAKELPADVQLVLCAGAPDTKEIMAEVSGLVADLQQERSGVVWIERILPQPELSALLTAADVFVCPSVYEPLGIVNLEAMACATAVVGTATGGIPEVIVDGETGRLVPIDQATDGTGTPLDPDRFVRDLAAALTEVVSDPETARRYGEAGRARAEQVFDWDAIGAQTAEIYRSLTHP
jgi:starch synthase